MKRSRRKKYLVCIAVVIFVIIFICIAHKYEKKHFKNKIYIESYIIESKYIDHDFNNGSYLDTYYISINNGRNIMVPKYKYEELNAGEFVSIISTYTYKNGEIYITNYELK